MIWISMPTVRELRSLHRQPAQLSLDGFENYFLEFYAPWCQHCQKFAPIWDEVAKSLHALAPSVNILVARIDGTKHSALMREMRADRFPALVFLHMNLQKRDPPELGITTYRGYRGMKEMTEFAVRMTERSVCFLNTTTSWREFVAIPATSAKVAISLVLPATTINFVDQSIARKDLQALYRSFTLASTNHIDRNVYAVTSLDRVAEDDADHALLSTLLGGSQTLGKIVVYKAASQHPIINRRTGVR
jgi:thiol-disulfide isomerase/thioredoxin